MSTSIAFESSTFATSCLSPTIWRLRSPYTSWSSTRTDLFFLLQHHDLYWEGPNARNFDSPFPEVADLIASSSCPDRANTTHVLINPIAAQALRERKAIHGTVIPDGFDFDRQVTPLDEQVFRERLEVLSGDG